jgi:hypothetical protein
VKVITDSADTAVKDSGAAVAASKSEDKPQTEESADEAEADAQESGDEPIAEDKPQKSDESEADAKQLDLFKGSKSASTTLPTSTKSSPATSTLQTTTRR